MGEKKHPIASISKALTALRRRLTLSECALGHDEALQKALDKAQPAEPKWQESDYEDAGIQHIDLCLRSDTSDGLWSCYCGHENPLTHYQGAYPFKYLTCGRCEHILCPHCRTSEIVTPLQSLTMEVFDPRFEEDSKEGRYGRLCRSCGLTHRAQIESGRIDSMPPCSCGKPTIEEGSYFFIGMSKHGAATLQDELSL